MTSSLFLYPILAEVRHFGIRAVLVFLAILVAAWTLTSRRRRKLARAAVCREVQEAYDSDAVRAARTYHQPSFQSWVEANPEYLFVADLDGGIHSGAGIEEAPVAIDDDAAPQEVGTDLQILFLGDTCFGASYHASSEKKGRGHLLKEKGYDFSFAGLDPLLQQADFVIANLETPFTDLEASPLEGKKQYVHWDDMKEGPAALQKHGFDVVSLANNHAFDFGEQGLVQTLKALDEHGITCIGAGVNQALASRALKREFKLPNSTLKLVVIAGKHKYREYKYEYYARATSGGVNAWTPESTVRQIRETRRAEPDAFLVAYPHWGQNYRWANDMQTSLAHAMIDAGADVVVGHGAHMLQEIELYRGRWIVYSLGNFVFNTPGRYGQRKDDVPYSFAGRLDVRERPDGQALSLRLYPIFSDNRVSGYQPRPVERDEFERILRSLSRKSSDWEEVRAEYDAGEDDLGLYLDLPIWVSWTGRA